MLCVWLKDGLTGRDYECLLLSLLQGREQESFIDLKKKKLTVVHPLIGAHNLFLGRKSLLHFTYFLASTFPSEKSSYLILLFVRMIIITKARLLSHT